MQMSRGAVCCMGPRAMATLRWRHRMPCRRSVASCAACTVDPRFSDTSASAYSSATSTAPRAASACPAGTCRTARRNWWV